MQRVLGEHGETLAEVGPEEAYEFDRLVDDGAGGEPRPLLADIVDDAFEVLRIHNPLVHVDPRVRRLAAAVVVLAHRPAADAG